MPKRINPQGRSVARTVGIALLLVFLLAGVSINSNGEQERFNAGAIGVVLATASVYAILALWILKAGGGARHWRAFLDYGGVVLLLAAIGVYFLWASLRAGRVM